MNSLVLAEPNEMSSRTQNRLMAFDRQLSANRPIVKGDPISSSAGCDWRGFLVEHHRVEGQELYDLQAPYTLIGMHMGEPVRVEVREDGPFEEKTFQPGDIAIIPAGARYSIRFAGPAEFLIMSLDEELVSCARQWVNGQTSELKVKWCQRDRFIRETIQNLRTTIEQKRQSGKIYAETLATSLALHILRNLGREGECGRSNRGGHGLSREQLQKTIEFIASTPYREISLATMSRAAGLSPFHFSRMFKLSTGLSPHQFVLRRRLEVGAEALVARKTPISDIAAELGFADQSHFTMHFKRFHGIAPAAYRRQKQSISSSSYTKTTPVAPVS